MKKLILLILMVIWNLPSFSQIATDTSLVVLPNEIAREVIKDLVQGEATRQELTIVNNKLVIANQKIVSLEEINKKLNLQIDNFKAIEENRIQQSEKYKNLVYELEKDLKKQKIKIRIYQSTSILGLTLILGLGVI